MSVRRASPSTATTRAALLAPCGAPGTLSGPAIAPKFGALKTVAPTGAPMTARVRGSIRGGFWLEGSLEDTPTVEDLKKDVFFGTLSMEKYADGLMIEREQFDKEFPFALIATKQFTHYTYTFTGLTQGEKEELLEEWAAKSRSGMEKWLKMIFDLPSMPVILARDRPNGDFFSIDDETDKVHGAFVHARNAMIAMSR